MHQISLWLISSRSDSSKLKVKTQKPQSKSSHFCMSPWINDGPTFRRIRRVQKRDYDSAVKTKKKKKRGGATIP